MSEYIRNARLAIVNSVEPPLTRTRNKEREGRAATELEQSAHARRRAFNDAESIFHPFSSDTFIFSERYTAIIKLGLNEIHLPSALVGNVLRVQS